MDVKRRVGWIIEGVELPTKRELGIGYLAGVGLALLASLGGYVWFTRESMVVIMLGVTMGVSLFATIIYIGYLLLDINSSGDFAWTVAQWTTVGFGIAALLSLIMGVSRLYLQSSTLLPSLLVHTIATGGVIGTLLGVVSGLREQHRWAHAVAQRNTVMNRVLRHNIRNDMNLVLGHAQMLDGQVEGPADQSVEAISQTANKVVRLSETARSIDHLETRTDEESVDVVQLIEDYLETARSTFPDADFTTDLPSSSRATVSEIVRPAVVNLVENAIEHNDGTAEVHIAVRTHGGDEEWVDIQVSDNGPGIPESQREILFDEEDPTHHGNGLGLWLVKWITDQHDGELWFEENQPRGTVAHLRLPVADRHPRESNRSVSSLRRYSVGGLGGLWGP